MPSKLEGQYLHRTLGVFDYEATYTTRMSASNWEIDWQATATSDGRVEKLSGHFMTLGSEHAAAEGVHGAIRMEIDALS